MMSRKFHAFSVAAICMLLAIWGTLTFSSLSAQVDEDKTMTTGNLGEAMMAQATLVVARPLPPPLFPTQVTEEGKVVVERPSATPEPTPDLGTAENPQTDPDKIFAEVKAFIEQYDAAIVGQSGWFYVRDEDYQPKEILHSNTGFIDGFPVEQLYPDETMIGEEWYWVDAEGNYEQKVGYTTDQTGAIRLGVAITDGKIVFFPFARVTSEGIHEQPPLLSITLGEPTVTYFDEILHHSQSSAQAWREDNSYVVFINHDQSPHKTDNIEDFTIVGGQIKCWFDLTSGAIQRYESVLREADGRLLINERVTYLERQYVAELPPEAAQLLEEAVQLIEEMEQ